MNRLLLLVVCLGLVAGASIVHADSASEAPPQVSVLKSAGVKVNAVKSGGWNIEVPRAKDLTQNIWQQIESLPNVTRFTCGEQFTDADLARLCKIQSIRSLYFNGPVITDAGLAALNHLPHLERFAVDHSTAITGSGLLTLKESTELTSLGFGGCIINDQGVESLVQLKQLKEVKLGHVRITRKSLTLLAALPELTRLELTPNWDTRYYAASDLAALASATELSELEIHDMVLPYDNGLEYLKALSALKTLNLFWCYVAGPDLAKLKMELPGVNVIIRDRAGPERLGKRQN